MVLKFIMTPIAIAARTVPPKTFHFIQEPPLSVIPQFLSLHRPLCRLFHSIPYTLRPHTPARIPQPARFAAWHPSAARLQGRVRDSSREFEWMRRYPPEYPDRSRITFQA